MRLAILSDIHSNLEALEKSLSILSTIRVNHIICLGDIVGYGSNPKECINLMRENSSYLIKGNHDEVANNLANISDFNRYAAEAILWTHKMLSQHEKDFLGNLQYKIIIDELLFIHSTPYKPEEWFYILTWEEAMYNFRFFENKICFVGHSHIPAVFSLNQSKNIINQSKITNEESFTSYQYILSADDRYIINVGSIGQPRDLDWRLSFGILDTQTWIYENIRAEYDVHKAIQKIYDSKLPRYLGDRLMLGK